MANNRQKSYDSPLKATITGIRDLFRKQVKAGVLLETNRLDGKTVLVDGSSSGLGLAVATECAKRGAKVIMACRSGIPGKGEVVKKRSGSEDVYMLHVDFSDSASIKELVKNVKELYAPVDIVVCNAGMVPRVSRKTTQGLEEMFMVNYFSKFIFVNLLLENQCLSADSINRPRIIFVSSESHRNPAGFEWDSFGTYRPYGIKKSVERYGYYKLLLTTFSAELSRRLNSTGKTKISVFALCPGPINSNIGREAPLVFQPILKLVFFLFFKSPEKAAIPVIYLAASPDEEGKAFDYLFLMSRKNVDEKASFESNGKKLWELSEKLLQSISDQR